MPRRRSCSTKGSYAEALVAFRQAYNASSSPNARLMIGQCLIGLGKTADAYEEMFATRSEAEKRAATEPKYLPTRDAADTQIALLEPRVAKVVIEVAGEVPAEIAINGSRIARERLGSAIAVDPGTIVITATRPDGRVTQQERAVKAGETTRIAVVFAEGPKKIEAPAGAVEATPRVVEDGPRPFGTVRAAGIAVAGLGVAGMAVFGIAGGLARGKFSQLEKECGGQRCTDPAFADVVDSGKTLTTISTVGLVAGLAGLAGGGVMIVVGGPAAPAKATGTAAARAAVTVSPAGAGLRCTVTF